MHGGANSRAIWELLDSLVSCDSSLEATTWHPLRLCCKWQRGVTAKNGWLMGWMDGMAWPGAKC